jgi:hypothetical protein
MKQIHIKRDGSGNVTFETVSIDDTENVFFTNQDPKSEHWPTLATNKLGKAPSANSSQCPVPAPQVTNPSPPPPTTDETPPYTVFYGCKITGHQNEKGTINVFAQLAAVATTALTATKGQATNQPLVTGGMPAYTISDLFVNNNSVPGTSTGPTQTLPIGTDLELVQDNQGISIAGTPTQAETYNFTFTVNDSMGRNLQQVQYSMTVS